MNRRTWLLGGTGAAAAAAGLAWQLRKGEPEALGAAPPAAAVGEPAVDEAGIAAVWQARFQQPDGQTLSLATLRGAPLVINFWATWCAPCVKEMPELDRFARQFAGRGVRVVGLAIDQAEPVQAFLARSPVSYAIGLAGFAGSELSRNLGNASGSLPFTAVFDRQGRLVQRKLGETRYDELSQWVAAL
jgi:thiol-disulfide isomerase/thioredoxin